MAIRIVGTGIGSGQAAVLSFPDAHTFPKRLDLIASGFPQRFWQLPCNTNCLASSRAKSTKARVVADSCLPTG